MTNAEKRELRLMVQNHAERSDAEIARLVCCHPSTVRKYRKVFGSKPAALSPESER